MNFDISHLLDQWQYKPGQVVVRKFTGKDGQEKIQLRVDLGILQMNAQGRPDGKRPFGQVSLFDYYLGREKQATGKENAFSLGAEDCAKLQLETLQYHHRYICFLQLEEYSTVVRETERNLKVIDFVEEHADNEELAWSLLQFRPQVMMLRTRAVATQHLLANDFDKAIAAIQEGLDELKNFFVERNRAEIAEQSPEIQSLQQWLEEVRIKRPLSKREQLESDLEDAVQREDYEKAAKVRDALKNLKPSDETH